MKTCTVCSATLTPVFKGQVLKKHSIQYYSCPNCEFSCTEEPYWLEEAYSSPIASLDIGILARNVYFTNKIANILFFLGLFQNKGLDFGGGYGIFTRMMRDIGFQFQWMDKYSPNMFAKGHEYKSEGQKPGIITALEVIEHIPNPQNFFREVLEYSSEANILVSTETFEKFSKDWWYLTEETGQHVSFFSPKTFDILAKQYGRHYTNFKDVHLFTKEPVSPLKIAFIKLIQKPIIRDISFYLLKRKTKSLIPSDYEKIRAAI